VPSDLSLKMMNAVHRALLAVTGRRLGTSFGGAPALELVTTGRRSGEPRAVMLTAPLQIDDAYVVVASRGGDDTHPAWFLNLSADPRVEVALPGGPRRRMTAEVVGPERRAELWPRIVASAPQYARYQSRTTREIPVVLLRPDPA